MSEPIDLVGGPFAVIESDPGVFTSLTRQLGIKNIELTELYDIEPWAVDHLQPHGLIFCFGWKKDKDAQDHRPHTDDFQNDPVEQVWFANQLSDDACASHAILNVLFNCDKEKVDIGEELSFFREETRDMSGVMKGLAVSSSHLIRKAHNSLARPADIRGAQITLALTSLSAQKKAAKSTTTKSQAKPKRNTKTTAKTSPPKPAKKKEENEKESEDEEAYHFIGYVPAYGKVWELDGFKSHPLEVGELSSSPAANWMDVVRPALRMKMAKYGESGRFSLLAVVDGLYEKASDEWEYWKRERKSVERRLQDIDTGWKEKVDPTILFSADEACVLSDSHQAMIPSTARQGTFASSFASRRLESDRKIIQERDSAKLVKMYETAVKECLNAKVSVEDELTRGKGIETDCIKRTYDYEPFLCEFVKCLHAEGLVDALIEKPKPKKAAANGRGKSRKKMKLDDDADEDDGKWEP
ncbi:hypothetical protein V5O48_005099 [Marasmius crinis-equi]|uniref:ubiquitinyl hydrolase 1 n=1 Tax=Marasmius crinis-equi TaxID=585013 RepID=A0ABR3FN86_9AGAR